MRHMTVLFSESYVWMGQQQNQQAEMEEIFGHSCEIDDVSEFFIDSDENVQEELWQLKDRLSAHPHIRQADIRLAIEDVVTPHERQRLKAWRAFVRKECPGGNIAIIDVAQWPDFSGNSKKDILPTLTRNILLYDVVRERLVTSRELFLSHGHPVMHSGPGSQVGSHGSPLNWLSTFDALSR